MIEHLQKYGVTEDDRTLYHQVQSFHWSDTITPEQAHEIGLRTAREMYPDFQVAVAARMNQIHMSFAQTTREDWFSYQKIYFYA